MRCCIALSRTRQPLTTSRSLGMPHAFADESTVSAWLKCQLGRDLLGRLAPRADSTRTADANRQVRPHADIPYPLRQHHFIRVTLKCKQSAHSGIEYQNSTLLALGGPWHRVTSSTMIILKRILTTCSCLPSPVKAQNRRNLVGTKCYKGEQLSSIVIFLSSFTRL